MFKCDFEVLLLKSWFENSFRSRYLIIFINLIYILFAGFLIICLQILSLVFHYCILFSTPMEDKNTCLYLLLYFSILSFIICERLADDVHGLSVWTRFYWKNKKFRYILSRVAKNSTKQRHSNKKNQSEPR